MGSHDQNAFIPVHPVIPVKLPVLMNNFLRNFITEWRRLELPFADATVVAAVSGGADSVSLLLALKELREMKKLDLRIVIAHFNHELRGEESKKDEEFVRQLTSDYKLEFAVGHWMGKHEGNLEQNARNARYEFLTRTAENLRAYAVITAHTMNDQAETFLINLIRGSGPDGLGGMKPVRSLESGLLDLGPEILLVRPMLNWARRIDTEAFCHDMGVEYRYDTMNEDLAFKRVRVRKILIPMLEDFNPKIIETLAKTAGLMRERSASAGNSPALDITEALKLKDLKKLDKPDLYNTLRAWLTYCRGNLRQIDLKHVEAIASLINSRKSGKTIELPGGDTVVKKDGKLAFARKPAHE
jgi:tRNA(Ile)-lysidine synthase